MNIEAVKEETRCRLLDDPGRIVVIMQEQGIPNGKSTHKVDEESTVLVDDEGSSGASETKDPSHRGKDYLLPSLTTSRGKHGFRITCGPSF